MKTPIEYFYYFIFQFTIQEIVMLLALHFYYALLADWNDVSFYYVFHRCVLLLLCLFIAVFYCFIVVKDYTNKLYR